MLACGLGWGRWVNARCKIVRDVFPDERDEFRNVSDRVVAHEGRQDNAEESRARPAQGKGRQRGTYGVAESHSGCETHPSSTICASDSFP